MAALAQPIARLTASPWWQSRSGVERKAIVVAGIVIAAMLIWMLLVVPMQRDTDVLVRQLSAARTSLSEARRQSDDIATLARTTGAPTPGDARSDLDTTLAKMGAKPIAIDRIDNQRLRVTFDSIGFDTLMTLLANLQRDGHLRAVELTATGRVEPGQVRAEMTLAR
jgi:type II secretory pathway component PulM